MDPIAIYSRKSKWTGKGESIENQVLMCREYIMKFVEGAEDAEIMVYEDEGFSGKNTKRPKFQRMLKDMKERHFSCLVCYKLDRLGRNLADLAALMEQLEDNGISFISIKEKFDTTTPIGKAMLYFSGVLAQMEREQIAERVRDNMILLARSGRWLGGNPPLGYMSQKSESFSGAGKKKTTFYLEENSAEISTARLIFRSFLERQSLTQVVCYTVANGITTRYGKEFSVSGIRDILRNPVYCTADREAYEYFFDLGCQICIDPDELDGVSGLMSYAKTSSGRIRNQEMDFAYWIISKGKHRGLVSGRDYVRIQKLLEYNREKGEGFRRVGNGVSVLSGLLYCTCGHAMRPKNYPAARVTEKGERTFSYRCPYKDRTHGERCQMNNVHGNTLDGAVCRMIAALVKPDKRFAGMLEELKREITQTEDPALSEEELLQREREKKQEQIRNLLAGMKRLDTESATIRYVSDEIAKLDGEVKNLQSRIDDLKADDNKKSDIISSIDEMRGLITGFNDGFWLLSTPEKRELLRSIVQRVVWTGEEAVIYLREPVYEGCPALSSVLHEADRITR